MKNKFLNAFKLIETIEFLSLFVIAIVAIIKH
jgi:hypothetical protein